jgi:tellurite resistance protein
MTAPKIPMNLFAIPFGLAGLGEAWSALSGEHHAPALVGDVILLISAACWLVLVAAHLRHLLTVALSAVGEISADLLDPVLAPFTSLVLITPTLLASDGLFQQAAMPGRVLTDVFIALTVLLAGWFVGQCGPGRTSAPAPTRPPRWRSGRSRSPVARSRRSS